MINFKLNGSDVTLPDDIDVETPLLWVLRDVLDHRGTKYGCGIAQCGACTVHLDDLAVQACVTPVRALEGKEVTTIEGLSENGDHPVQLAWKENNVPQCGYCQPGQIMQAAALLKDIPDPTDYDINTRMWNICRCGTYPRIRAAIKDVAKKAAEQTAEGN